jgi:hypothetical protein
MLVAIRDFHDELGVLVERGDQVHEASTTARAFPQNFAPVSRSAGIGGGLITRTGGASQLVGRPLSRSAGEVEFHERSPLPVTIRVEPQARGEIEREIDWCNVNGRGFADREFKESGGYLYSRFRPTLDTVNVVLASGPGPDSLHAPRAFRRSSLERIEQELFAERPRDLFTLCGCWHSHPVPHDQPSSADTQAWVSRAEAFGPLLSGWVSLIVTPHAEGYGWSMPQVSGFVTRHNGARWSCARTPASW